MEELNIYPGIQEFKQFADKHGWERAVSLLKKKLESLKENTKPEDYYRHQRQHNNYTCYYCFLDLYKKVIEIEEFPKK